jgi:hypothetical protein
MSSAVAARSAVSPLAGRPAPEQMPAQPEAGRPTLQSTFSEAHVLNKGPHGGKRSGPECHALLRGVEVTP